MSRRARAEDAFQEVLEGTSAAASPELAALAKLAAALEPAARPGPDPRFGARLRSTLLAEAARSEEDVFAAMLDGERVLEAPAEMMAMASVAGALEPSARVAPAPEFRFRLRNTLIAEATKPKGLGARLAGSVESLNTRLARTRRRLAAVGVAAVMMLGSGSAIALAQDDVPGEGLYAVKLLHEDVQLWAARGTDQGYRSLAFARRRLSEVRTLTGRGETDHMLYIGAFDRMDRLTVEGSDILLAAFENGDAPEAVGQVKAFAAEQAAGIGALVEAMPPGARPVAQDSIATVESIADRAARVECGCDPLAGPPAIGGGDPDRAGPGDEPHCACDGPAPVGDPDRTADEPTGDDGRDPRRNVRKDDGGGDDGEPEPADPTVEVPDVPGSDVDDEVEDVVNEVIDDLIGRIGEPSAPPVPSLP